MNKETYEALRRLVATVELMTWHTEQDAKDIKQINVWIDEVAKDYVGIECKGCGEEILENQAVVGDRHATCV